MSDEPTDHEAEGAMRYVGARQSDNSPAPDDVVKRLLREIISAPDINGGRRMVPLNPDGPDGAAEITHLRAEVERLAKHRDKILAENSRLLSAFVAAERNVAKLREALRPFADELKGNYSSQADEFPIVCGGGMYDIRFTLTLQNFRRAVTALAETEKE